MKAHSGAAIKSQPICKSWISYTPLVEAFPRVKDNSIYRHYGK